ncbi:hypothetical protein Micbo1qcDRAFT_155068, partial [Microdochium bolleyi]
MPFYEVSHAVPLSDAQKDEIAQAITKIHTTRFTTPSLFVNVKFTDAANESYYVGGKRRRANRVSALVRAGGGRTAESFNALAQEIHAAWDRVLLGTDTGGATTIPVGDERELRVVAITGSILGGVENGIVLPQAGEDVEWLRTNLPKFEKLAEQGHE